MTAFWRDSHGVLSSASSHVDLVECQFRQREDAITGIFREFAALANDSTPERRATLHNHNNGDDEGSVLAEFHNEAINFRRRFRALYTKTTIKKQRRY
jgi:hypothetical protein